MLKKSAISSAIIAVLLLSSSGIALATDGAETSTPVASHPARASESEMYGEIVGSFNSPDGMVVGATLPGKSVSFSIPVKKRHGQYLHFAFMHAASASDGWFFAPVSERGINLTSLAPVEGKSVDITEQIALFQAPAADQLEKVTADKDKLKYGPTTTFMTAELTHKNGMYVITIKNNSAGDYETPFSSGVWGVTNTATRSFDHTPSPALSTLATTGHRNDLYRLVQKQIPEINHTPSMELTRAAIKMAKEQMMDHKKIGSISGTAATQAELEHKFARAAAQMGARYFVITALSNKNTVFGNADIYE